MMERYRLAVNGLGSYCVQVCDPDENSGDWVLTDGVEYEDKAAAIRALEKRRAIAYRDRLAHTWKAADE